MKLAALKYGGIYVNKQTNCRSTQAVRKELEVGRHMLNATLLQAVQ